MVVVIPPKGSIPPAIRAGNVSYRMPHGAHYDGGRLNYSGNNGNHSAVPLGKHYRKPYDSTRIDLRHHVQDKLSWLEEEIEMCVADGLDARVLMEESGRVRKELETCW